MRAVGKVLAFSAVAAFSGVVVVGGVVLFALWDAARMADDRYSDLLEALGDFS